VLPAPYPYGGDELALYSRLPKALILRLCDFVAKNFIQSIMIDKNLQEEGNQLAEKLALETGVFPVN